MAIKKPRKDRKDITVGTLEKKRGMPPGTVRNADGRDTRSDKKLGTIQKELAKHGAAEDKGKGNSSLRNKDSTEGRGSRYEPARRLGLARASASQPTRASAQQPARQVTEEELERRLVSKGVIAERKRDPSAVAAFRDYRPAKVAGRPLSEMIIKERR